MPDNAPRGPFNLLPLLTHAGLRHTAKSFGQRRNIFDQGDKCDGIYYLVDGRVSLSVLSTAGRSVVVGEVHADDFFGEGCLAGQTVRMSTATAVKESTVLLLEIKEMTALLQRDHAVSERFTAHLLARNIRIEAELVAHLFNGVERRLARVLLLLARYNEHHALPSTVPAISQQILAEMVGTTRPRINHFMNKFRRLGFIDYADKLTVRPSLLTVILHD